MRNWKEALVRHQGVGAINPVALDEVDEITKRRRIGCPESAVPGVLPAPEKPARPRRRPGLTDSSHRWLLPLCRFAIFR